MGRILIKRRCTCPAKAIGRGSGVKVWREAQYMVLALVPPCWTYLLVPPLPGPSPSLSKTFN